MKSSPSTPIFPSNLTRLSFRQPQFIRCKFLQPFFPEEWKKWYLIGPDSTLPFNAVIEVVNLTEGKAVSVVVRDVVAERIVHHTPGSYSYSQYGPTTRYVICRFWPA